MHRRGDHRSKGGRKQDPVLAGYAKYRADQGLGRGRSQAQHDPRLDLLDLRLEPGPAGADLLRVRPLVDATLAAWFPFEVLHHVRYVGLAAVDPSFFERAIQHLPGRTDERRTGHVLAVARLLADEHEPGSFGSLAKDGLRRALPQVAGTTSGRSLPQLFQRGRASGTGAGASMATF